jgi:hypothetical protein
LPPTHHNAKRYFTKNDFNERTVTGNSSKIRFTSNIELKVEQKQQFLVSLNLTLFFFTRFVMDNKKIGLQLVDNFLIKASPVFINSIQLMGHNKPRQREKIAHFLNEFVLLQDEVVIFYF